MQASSSVTWIRERVEIVPLTGPPPGHQITNEAHISEWFWIPQPAKLGRRKIVETIKAGTAVIWAEFANSRVN